MIANKLEKISHAISYPAKSFKDLQNLIVQDHGALVQVTLNRPKALNALDSGTVRELLGLLPILEKYKVIWMEGAGGKAFCAGGDIKEQIKPEITDDGRIKLSKEEYELCYHISQI